MHLDVMTPYEINRAIAKEAGWTFDKSDDTWNGPNGEELSRCPDFYSELDLIQAVLLEESQEVRNNMCHVLFDMGLMFVCDLLVATAAQRCEAYLKVKGLWKV